MRDVSQLSAELRAVIEELIEMMVLGGANLDCVMETWRGAPDPGASVHLASLAKELTSKSGQLVYFRHVLAEHAVVCRAIGQFVHRREQVQCLEITFFMLDDRPELQTMISDAQGFIESELPVEGVRHS